MGNLFLVNYFRAGIIEVDVDIVQYPAQFRSHPGEHIGGVTRTVRPPACQADKDIATILYGDQGTAGITLAEALVLIQCAKTGTK